MPVEIKELVIRAVVNEGNAGGENAVSGQQESSEMIIKACVDRVMEILIDKKER